MMELTTTTPEASQEKSSIMDHAMISMKGFGFQTKMAFCLTAGFVAALGTLSFMYAPDDSDFTTSRIHHHARFLEEGDAYYEDFTCNEFYDVTSTHEERCQFARACGDGEGLWAPWVFCVSWLSPQIICLLCTPLALVWLILLFRLLGSTAEDYFSPSLEMFSVKLGLPPRFAGVSLLALGNGAADVSAAINAITSDPENGYKMSLGALTGSAMFVGGVVSAVVVIVAGGVRCRGALVRDVSMMIVTILTVWLNLRSGEIGPRSISQFTTLYGVFVLLVLVADTYHRGVVVPRQQERENRQERERQLAEGQRVQEAAGESIHSLAMQADQQQLKSSENGNKAFGRFMTALSNYDISNSIRVGRPNGWGIESDQLDQDRPVMLHGPRGLIHGHPEPHQEPLSELRQMDHPHSTANYAMLEELRDDARDPSYSSRPAYNWRGAVEDGKKEFTMAMNEVWDDIAWNGDLNRVEKFFLICEFPFTILRKITVPVPCEGYYNKSVLAVSMAVSPLWLMYYFWDEHDVTIFKSVESGLYVFCGLLFFVGIAALVLRFAPSGGDSSLSMAVAAPIALYGFVVGATWIDAIAEHLVELLDFVAVLLRIPAPIIGLTILAWGNSVADLSANVAMARKGLANMSMTACFAGPVFNILMGMSLGFSSLAAQTGQSTKAVELETPIKVGVGFTVINCCAILTAGMYFGRGRIPQNYGYISIGIYILYVTTSIGLQYLM